jgi:hypothetical protein
MAEEVKVIIGADASKLASELQLAQNNLRKFEIALRKATNVKEVEYLTRNIGLLKEKISTLNTSQGGLTTSSVKAGQALNDLSRIAQDAPYGFIGISNNINPLIESFQRLSAETKNSGGPLKALAGALTGPAGLGLAFGLFSAAISFASIGLSRWVKTSGEAKQKTKDFNDELNKSKESAMATGIQLQSFVDIAKNTTLPLSQRNEALKQANDLMGKHGELLTLNNVGTQQITTQTKLYTEALIQQAVAQKYTNKIAELTIAKNEKLIQLQQAQTTLAKEKAKPIPIGQGAIGAAKFIEIFTQRVIDAQKEVTGVDNEIVKLGLELQKSTNIATSFFGQIGEKAKDSKDKSKSLGESIDQIIAKFRRKLTAEEALGLPPMEEIKAKINDYEAVIKKLITDKKVGPSSNIILNLKAELGELNDQLLFQQIYDRMLKDRREIKLMNPFVFEYTPEQQAIIDRYQQKLANESKKAALKQAELGGMGLVIPIKPKIDFSGIQGAVNKSKIDLQKIFTDSFSQLGADLATSIGEGLGNAISGKDSALQGMLDNISLILANAMVSIGKQIIVLATGLEAVYTALMSNPVTALLAGIALVALGTAAKNQLSKTKAFATGTSFAPGGTALVGERGPELVNLPRGSRVIPNGKTNAMMQGAMQAVEVYGTLRGQDIYFSNKNYGKTYNRLS